MSRQYGWRQWRTILPGLVLLLGMLVCSTAAAEDYSWLNEYLSADEETAAEIQETEEIGFPVVTFGVWPQDDDPQTPPEPIQWYVLQNEDNKKCLLLSVYAIDGRAFQNSSISSEWPGSLLRKWIKKQFYQNAFTKQEKKSIVRAKVKNGTVHSAPEWPRAAEGSSSDNVFLLSYGECFNKYMKSAALRVCRPTAYAVSQGVAIVNEEQGTCYWWTRTAANHRYTRVVVLEDGTYSSADMRIDCIGVRPAVWVRYSAIADQLTAAE